LKKAFFFLLRNFGDGFQMAELAFKNAPEGVLKMLAILCGV
jgi:hypothetical protein